MAAFSVGLQRATARLLFRGAGVMESLLVSLKRRDAGSIFGGGGVVTESVPVFTALAWANSSGRRVAIVRCDRQRPANGSGLVNRNVRIDGRLWYCTAVDRDRATGPMMAGERIYLWVRSSSRA